MLPDTTEQTLRAAVARSREEGFRMLFQHYQGYVYAIVWGRLCGVGTYEDAEETVTDIFAEVFRSFDDIHDGTLRGYIGTIARRRAINAFHRLSGRGGDVSLDEEDFPELPAPETVDTQVETRQMNGQLLSCIEQLGEPDASIIIQKYYYDRKSGDIAKALHLDAVTVRVRAHRALKRLKKLLEKEGIS